MLESATNSSSQTAFKNYIHGRRKHHFPVHALNGCIRNRLRCYYAVADKQYTRGGGEKYPDGALFPVRFCSMQQMDTTLVKNPKMHWNQCGQAWGGLKKKLVRTT